MPDLGPIIDCDVHPAPRSPEELFSYLPAGYHNSSNDILASWFRMNRGTGVFTGFGALATGMRQDAIPKAGHGGSDPELMDEQLFGDAGITSAVLIPLTVTNTADPRHEAALCAATNAWLAQTWLTKYNGHGRYYGSISICPDTPELAVAEIERWAEQPGFVQVMIPPMPRAPYNSPQYRPIFAAAAAHNLPVSIHINRTPGMALLSPVGYVSYYFEFHPQYTLYYSPHVASMVLGGVLAEFPTLKLVLVEGGVSWLAPFAWRLDHYWREFPGEVSLDRAPSEYIREQVYVTTQPLEQPDRVAELQRYLRWVGADTNVLFSSDYPHWDYDDPAETLRRFPTQVQDNVAWRNAARVYNIPAAV